MRSYSIGLSVWFLSLIIIPSKFMHVLRIFSFSWLNNIPLCLHIPQLLYPFILDRNLDCFHILAIENSVAMTLGMQVSLQDSVFNFCVYIPRSGIAGSFSGSIFLIFWGLSSILFSIVAVPFAFLPTVAQVFPFSPHPH